MPLCTSSVDKKYCSAFFSERKRKGRRNMLRNDLCYSKTCGRAPKASLVLPFNCLSPCRPRRTICLAARRGTLNQTQTGGHQGYMCKQHVSSSAARSGIAEVTQAEEEAGLLSHTGRKKGYVGSGRKTRVCGGGKCESIFTLNSPILRTYLHIYIFVSPLSIKVVVVVNECTTSKRR